MRSKLFQLLLAAAVFVAHGQAQNAGYWQYVKTDSYIVPYAPETPYPDSYVGGEGNISVTVSQPITVPRISPAPALGATYRWSRPPAILIPGNPIYWPVSATVDRNNPGRYLGWNFTAGMYPYQPVSDLKTARPWATSYYASVATDWSMPVGTSVSDNDALRKNPLLVPVGGSVWSDANGLTTILTWITGGGSSSVFYWSYVYKWVPGRIGSCGGTCTVASPGQSIGAAGGSGSVGITATSTWNVVAVDSWITVTSPTSGSGNSSVTYTVSANTGGPRSGTLVIGGQPYTIYQGSGQAGGSTGASTCARTCSLGAPGQPVAATSSTGTVSVTATSSWTAADVDNWIHITSGATGTGNGTVGFTVDANTGGPRNGAISVAGQTYTIFQNGTPAGITSGCAYLIQSSTVQSVPNTGTNGGLIQVITNQNCAWTATTAATWITLRSGTSSTGNGAVAYSVPQNDTANPRSGAIVINGQNVVVNQAAGTVAPPPGTPAISAGGVVNTASYAPGGPPNGSLAQGSFFSIYGSSVGPDAPVQARAYPLPNSLGSVSVQITQGSSTYSAYLVFVVKGQINAILPSDVPVGSAQMTITSNGLTSQPATITVAKTSFGVFFQQVNGVNLAIAQNVNSATDYPLNLPGTPAKPGQIVIFWGTGLGPISGVDNTAPGAIGDMTSVPVTITVGGIAAQRVYAGRQSETAAVDNIYITVPAGVPFGCQVPVVITAGGVAANTTMIAITADGSPCQ